APPDPSSLQTAQIGEWEGARSGYPSSGPATAASQAHPRRADAVVAGATEDGIVLAISGTGIGRWDSWRRTRGRCRPGDVSAEQLAWRRASTGRLCAYV